MKVKRCLGRWDLMLTFWVSSGTVAEDVKLYSIETNLRPGHMLQNCGQHCAQLESCTGCPPLKLLQATLHATLRSRIGSFFCNITRNCFTVCPSSATLCATSWCNVACSDASFVRALKTELKTETKRGTNIKTEIFKEEKITPSVSARHGNFSQSPYA